MRISTAIFAVFLAAAIGRLLASCSYVNTQSVDCALQKTVTDAAQLDAIVTACQQVAVTSDAVPNCILAAAASKWTQDEITCFVQAKTVVIQSIKRVSPDANIP